MPRLRCLLIAMCLSASVGGTLLLAPAHAKETAATLFVDARDQFSRGRYTQAITQLRELLDQFPGSAEAEDATWYLAESYRANKDWTLAQVQYEHLLSSFPGSPRRGDAMYGLGDAFWHQAHGAPYDQDFSERALAQFQRFLAAYPEHPKATEARVGIQAATNRLAERAFRESRTYFSLRDLDALQLYVTDLNARYPQTVWADRGMLLLGRALLRDKRLGEAHATFTALAERTADAEVKSEARKRAAELERRLGQAPSARAQ